MSDISLPQGVEIVALTHEDDKSVVSIHLPRVEAESTEPAETSAEVPASAQKGEEESKE